MSRIISLEEYKRISLKNKYSKASFEKNKARWEINIKKSYDRYVKIQEALKLSKEYEKELKNKLNSTQK